VGVAYQSQQALVEGLAGLQVQAWKVGVEGLQTLASAAEGGLDSHHRQTCSAPPYQP
jgi:hypothetical protein